MVITSITAVTLTLLYVWLSLRVIGMRRAKHIPLGVEGDESFVRAVRTQANLGEYAPLFLILLFLLEYQQGSFVILSLVAGVFVIGRVMHAIGFGYIGTGPWRTFGMAATYTALIIASAMLVYHIL